MIRIVVMGVSGSGKSSVGEALGKALGVRYVDGDGLHPAENVQKMAAGVALTDADRWGWLDRVAAVLQDEAPVIVGCSALKRVYRERIRAGVGAALRFVWLEGSRELIEARMAARRGHYMPVSLLDSQFAALEVPVGEADVVAVGIDRPVAEIVQEIVRRLT